MTKSSKFKATAAVAGACAALFASLPANAYVYAVSKLQIRDLNIGIFQTGTTTPDVGAASNYTFTLKNSADYTPPGGSTLADSGNASCNGTVGAPNLPCQLATPVLDAKVANAPGLTSARAENNFNILGSSGPWSYSNADSQITTAKLVQVVANPLAKTSTVQIAESLLNVNGIASANTAVTSTTTLLTTNFSTTVATDLSLSFQAMLDLIGDINDMSGGLYTAAAHSDVQLVLTRTGVSGSTQRWVWTPDGDASTGCNHGTGGINIGTSVCSVTAENGSLYAGDSKSSNGDYFDQSTGGFKDFGISITNLIAGSYSLSLVSKTDTTVDRTYVPEPGSLALVGLALAGLGVAGKRRARKQ